MQYFVGLSEFTDKPIFNPSLFLTIRKRLGNNDFNDTSVSLLKIQVEKSRAAALEKKNDKDDSSNGSSPEECTVPVFTAMYIISLRSMTLHLRLNPDMIKSNRQANSIGEIIISIGLEKRRKK